MAQDYLADLKYLGLISRLKRLSDSTIASGRALYKRIDIGIEPNWFLIFRIVMEKERTSISEITSILQFSHPSVISIVKKMEKAGYLKITSHPTDMRRQVIQLSEKAKEQLPEMQNVWNACETAVQSVFKDNVFLEELEKVEKAFNNYSFSNRVLDLLQEDEIIIEPFTSEDVRKFSGLNQQWLKKHFRLEPIDKKVLNAPTENILEKGGQIFMARLSGKTVGTVAMVPLNNKEVELCRMAVQQEFRGKGIGKRLIEKSITYARKNSYKSIFLYSNTLLEPAIKLYTKMGFENELMENDVIYDRANIKMRIMLDEK